MLRCFAFGLTALLSLNGYADTARGSVFEDRNGNGLQDEGELGIEGVRVSDGKSFTQSDANGSWLLDIAEEAVVFVVKPTGYRTRVAPNQIPQFYYIHQPTGSPEGLRYPGIEPTGELPERIDFPLTRQDEPSVFDAILFADTQPQTDAEVDFIRDGVVAELIGTDARFGMTMGDILFDDLSLFPRLLDIVGQIGIPWYNVPGNHELNHFAETDEYSLETFKRYFGPPYYTFEYAGAHFFVLDNIEYKGNGESDPGDIRGSGGYIANFGKAQLAWLKKALAFVPDDALVFIAMHAPLETYVGEAPGITTADRKDLFKLLAGRENLYSVAGHTHTTEHLYFDADDGFRGPTPFHHHVLTAVSGSWWSGPFDDEGIPTSWQRDGTPRGYHVLTVDSGNASVRYKAAGESADYQMRIMYDVHYQALEANGLRDYRHGELFNGRMNISHVPAASVLVNVFDGGPNTRVFASIAGLPEQAMQRVERKDLLVNELLLRNADSKKSWVNANPSSHIFELDLPDALPVGVHTISIRAVDEFGRTHHGHSILEIEGR